VLPATETEILAPDPRAAFHPTVIDGTRPAFDLERMTAVMAAFEGYVDASFMAVEGIDPPASVSDEALDVRLATL